MGSIYQFLEKSIQRRAFIQRLTVVSSSFVAGVLGMPKTTFGCDPGTGCCNLCLQHDNACTEAHCMSLPDKKCYWSWLCSDNFRNGKTCMKFRCADCFAVLPQNCPPTCPTNNSDCRRCPIQGVLCSYAAMIPGTRMYPCQPD